MIENLIFLFIFLLLLTKSAEYAIKYSKIVARKLHISEFIISFFIVALISALPEGTISILSAINGEPQLGLGTLIGSNVADLALVFGIAAIASGTGISVKTKLLKKDMFYLALLFFPVLSGLDGYYSRLEGVILIVAGLSFFFSLSSSSNLFKKKEYSVTPKFFIKNLLFLIFSLALLIISAHYTIKYGVILANGLGLPEVLIGLTVISIGSCLPELIFSLKAIRNKRDELALGDILGTVITDCTILVGIMALISPFSFDPMITYVTGFAMFFAGVIVTIFINTEKLLTKKEGIILLIFYIIFLAVEFYIHR
ncbi:MAG: hypothetical protein PHN56_02310 [Candidatus Nanoarchaeia archaeon]|nr:hypothetical protein [Candidatus Nanoarchaeia archaeon]